MRPAGDRRILVAQLVDDVLQPRFTVRGGDAVDLAALGDVDNAKVGDLLDHELRELFERIIEVDRGGEQLVRAEERGEDAGERFGRRLLLVRSRQRRVSLRLLVGVVGLRVGYGHQTTIGAAPSRTNYRTRSPVTEGARPVPQVCPQGGGVGDGVTLEIVVEVRIDIASL